MSKFDNCDMMFACNDYRNGHGQGWFDAVHIDNSEIELEGPRVGIRSLGNGRVRIGKMIFEHKGWAEWVGNWCWDQLTIVDGNRLLRYLNKRGWRCHCGPSKFFEKFNRRTESLNPPTD